MKLLVLRISIVVIRLRGRSSLDCAYGVFLGFPKFFLGFFRFFLFFLFLSLEMCRRRG